MDLVVPQAAQGAGWLPIHAIDLDLPCWLGTWFGLFLTWETLGAQALALTFVIGSYFAAEYVRVKRPRKRAAARVAAPSPQPEPAPERELEHAGHEGARR